MSKLKLLTIVSDKTIRSEGIPLAHLWLIFDGKNVLGPFRETDLQVLSSQEPQIFKNLKACSLDKDKWGFFFDYKCFNQRVSYADYSKVQFHYLDSGKVHGPLNLQKIKLKLQSNPGLYLSIDSGLSWKKAFEFGIVERRAHEAKIEKNEVFFGDFAVHAKKDKSESDTPNEYIEPIASDFKESRKFDKNILIASIGSMLILAITLFGVGSFESKSNRSGLERNHSKSFSFEANKAKAKKKVEPRVRVQRKLAAPKPRSRKVKSIRKKAVKPSSFSRFKKRSKSDHRRITVRKMEPLRVIDSEPMDESEIEVPELEVEKKDRSIASEDDYIEGEMDPAMEAALYPED